MSIFPDGEEWREDFERSERLRKSFMIKRRIKLVYD
jgi:hypothetical protein